jgi:N-acetylglucosamine-6-sulfatase
MKRTFGPGAGVLLGILGAVGAGLPAPARAAPPNLVFILTDDQRWDALGCAGHPFLQTPHMDRLAREGVRFRNAFVTTPLCSPSRASFLTGQYVHTHRVTGNRDHNARSHELVTFPRLLREAGYTTAYVGKWHMGNDDTPRPGFDRWVSFRSQGAYLNPQLNIDGKSSKVEGYMTDLLTDHAVEFLNRPHTKPFALYLAHKAVHGPFTPADRHKDLFADQPIPRAPNARDTLEGKPVLQRPVGNLPPLGPGTGSGDALIRNQLRTLVAVDDGLGRVLQALEEKKRLDDTVVIFTSDNGYFWGEHGLGDKRAAYDESIRIPLLMRYPRLIKAGTTLDAFALNIDIAPTLLDLAGVPIPEGLHGRSLVPLFKGDTRTARRAFLTEYFAEPMYPRIPSWQAVRSARWKYICYTGLEGMDELYDLQVDPYEMKNVIQEPGAQAALGEMKAELDRLLKETGADGR